MVRVIQWPKVYWPAVSGFSSYSILIQSRRIDVLVCFESLVFIARMIWRVQSLQRRAQVCFQFSRLQVQCHRFGKREGTVKDCQGERHMPAAQLAFIHRAIAAISSVEWDARRRRRRRRRRTKDRTDAHNCNLCAGHNTGGCCYG
jgi:hypothetical protein